MHDIELIYKKDPNYIILWTVIFTILIIFIYFIAFYKYTPYYKIVGILNNENNNISFIIDHDKISDLYNSEIIINKNRINNYDLIFSDNIYSENKIYNQVELSQSEEQVEDIVSIKLQMPRTTILKKLWKGMIE